MSEPGVKLRIACPEDAAAVQAIYAPFCEETEVSFELVAPSAEEMRGRIEGVLERFPWLVAVVDGKVAGYAYAGPWRTRAAYRWTCESAVYVDRTLHRGGVGGALYRCLFDVLRRQGMCRVVAGVSGDNVASVRFHEKLGFRQCGTFEGMGHKLGAWHTVRWFQHDLRGQEPPPGEAVPFAQFRHDAGHWRELAAAHPLAVPA